MNQKLLLLVLGFFFTVLSYAQNKEPKSLPKEVTSYIQQRTLCNQARLALIVRETPKEQIPANPKQQAQRCCMGSDTQYKVLAQKYQNNPKIWRHFLLSGVMVILCI